MKSVKGMTWGSPEFVATVKAAEREGEITALISEIEAETERLTDILRNHGDDLTPQQMNGLFRINRNISEVLYG